jgi:hypothetical protein
MRMVLAKAALITAIFLLVGVSVSGAGEYGCRVLLCMSNPAGPKSVSECAPTIDKLLSDMAKPNFSWPRCEEAESGGSRIVPTNERHEPCAQGFAETPKGFPAIRRSDYQQAQSPAQWIRHDESKYLKWIYPVYFSAEELYEESNKAGDSSSAGYVVCGKGANLRADIAKKYETREGEVKYRAYENAIVYDEIALAKRINAAMVVDVYIDGRLYKRVPLNY